MILSERGYNLLREIVLTGDPADANPWVVKGCENLGLIKRMGAARYRLTEKGLAVLESGRDGSRTGMPRER